VVIHTRNKETKLVSSSHQKGNQSCTRNGRRSNTNVFLWVKITLLLLLRISWVLGNLLLLLRARRLVDERGTVEKVVAVEVKAVRVVRVVVRVAVKRMVVKEVKVVKRRVVRVLVRVSSRIQTKSVKSVQRKKFATSIISSAPSKNRNVGAKVDNLKY
jgi:hypothetical protein